MIERHREALGLGPTTSDETLLKWYESFQPTGSGPLGHMKIICALIEELAEIYALELPPARGLKEN